MQKSFFTAEQVASNRTPKVSNLQRWLVLFAVAFVARFNSFGDPNYHVDESFYLLVGNSMHAGMAPYIDIWDRKPPGLFVLYWLIAAFGNSVLGFQIAAFVCCVLTGYALVKIAERWSSPRAALLAACLYIAYLQPLLGGGGQSPVFYNLLTCTGMLLLVRAQALPRVQSTLVLGLGASLLAGLAVSIKPTAVFEGALIVIGFAWREWREYRSPASRLARVGAFVVAAALPVIAIFAWYAAAGQLPELLQATVLSNFDKESAPPWLFRHTARYLAIIMIPIMACAALGWMTARGENRGKPMVAIMSLWAIAAIAGFLAVPNFYNHYALPLVPVLSVLCAPYFANRPFAFYIGVFLIVWALATGQSFDFSRGMRSKQQFDQTARVISANLNGGRLYVFDGPPGLYAATGAKWTGRYVFPEHLSNGIERRALGTDASREIAKVLAAKPSVIVITNSPKPTLNLVNFEVLRAAIAREFHPVCDMPMFDYEHDYRAMIYARSTEPDRSLCSSTPLPH